MIWFIVAWIMQLLWRLLAVPEPAPVEPGEPFWLDNYMDGDNLRLEFQADADEFAFLLLPADLPWQTAQSLDDIEYDVFERALDELELAAAELVW